MLTGPAWACSPNASIFYPGNVQAAPVPPGGVVTVEGVRFNGPDTEEQGGPVEILWNSMVGTPLTSAGGLSFSVQVRIPATAVPGETYYINAVQRSVDDPSVSWKASVPIEIAAPSPASPEVVTPPAETLPEETDTAVVTPPDEVATEEADTAVALPPVLSPPALAPPGLAPPVVAPADVSASPSGPGPAAGSLGPQSPSRASAGAGSGLIAAGPVGEAKELGKARSGAVAAPMVSAVRPGGRAQAGLVPVDTANPAKAWAGQPSEAPAPSLFEPTDSSGRRSPTGVPTGGGAVGVGLLAILGAGVVAGQRRLALASRRR